MTFPCTSLQYPLSSPITSAAIVDICDKYFHSTTLSSSPISAPLVVNTMRVPGCNSCITGHIVSSQSEVKKFDTKLAGQPMSISKLRLSIIMVGDFDFFFARLLCASVMTWSNFWHTFKGADKLEKGLSPLVSSPLGFANHFLTNPSPSIKSKDPVCLYEGSDTPSFCATAL